MAGLSKASAAKRWPQELNFTRRATHAAPKAPTALVRDPLETPLLTPPALKDPCLQKSTLTMSTDGSGGA